MANKSKSNGVNIKGTGSISIGGDVVGRDKTTNYTSNVSSFEQDINSWRIQMDHAVNNSDLPMDKKSDAKKQMDTIKETILNDRGKNPGRLEKLINALAIMGPEIFDVIVSTLANPLAGIGLVLKKISDKAQIEVVAK